MRNINWHLYLPNANVHCKISRNGNFASKKALNFGKINTTKRFTANRNVNCIIPIKQILSVFTITSLIQATLYSEMWKNLVMEEIRIVWNWLNHRLLKINLFHIYFSVTLIYLKL